MWTILETERPGTKCWNPAKETKERTARHPPSHYDAATPGRKEASSPSATRHRMFCSTPQQPNRGEIRHRQKRTQTSPHHRKLHRGKRQRGRPILYRANAPAAPKALFQGKIRNFPDGNRNRRLPPVRMDNGAPTARSLDEQRSTIQQRGMHIEMHPVRNKLLFPNMR